MKRTAGLIGLILLAGVPGLAALPDRFLDDPDVSGILSNNCIVVTANGRARADFVDLVAVNGRPDLLEAIQREYAAMLPDGEKPEFKVEETAPGRFFYLNRKNQESHVRELLRAVEPDGKLHAVYCVSGERFFGEFRALVHVVIEPAGPDEVRYAVEVQAWPHNRFSRMLARGLHIAIESFFRQKTGFMTGLVLDLCSRLVAEPSV